MTDMLFPSPRSPDALLADWLEPLRLLLTGKMFIGGGMPAPPAAPPPPPNPPQIADANTQAAGQAATRAAAAAAGQGADNTVKTSPLGASTTPTAKQTLGS